MDTNSPGALQAADGSYYNPLDFRPKDVKIGLIAHQLALKCRWNGNTNDLTEACNPVFYSVAQHSCIVHDLARDCKKLFHPDAEWDREPCPSTYGLLHDGGEGPYMDVPRPLKQALPELKEIEKPIIRCILTELQIPVSRSIIECVKRIDDAMIFWERDLLMGKPSEPYQNEESHPGGSLLDLYPKFYPWSPAKAKYEFLARYYAFRSANPLSHAHLRV